MQCKNCGHQLPPNTKFCTKCGTQTMSSSASVCPQCGFNQNADSKFCIKCGVALKKDETVRAHEITGQTCPKCGNKLKEGASFCIHCGASFSDAKSAVSESEQTCPRCHAKLSPNAAFCVKCGERISKDIGFVEPAADEGAADADQPNKTDSPAEAAIDATIVYRKTQKGKKLQGHDSGASSSAQDPDNVAHSGSDNADSAKFYGKPSSKFEPTSSVRPANSSAHNSSVAKKQPQEHVNGNREYVATKQKKRSRKGLIVGIIIGVLLLIIGGCAAFILTSNAFTAMKELSDCEFEAAVERYDETIRDNPLQKKIFDFFVSRQYRSTTDDYINGKLDYSTALEYCSTVVGMDAIEDDEDIFAETVASRVSRLSDAYNNGTTEYAAVKAELSEIAKHEEEILKTNTAADLLNSIEAHETAKSALLSGDEALDKGDYAAAIEAYQSINESSPLFAEAAEKLISAKTAYKEILLSQIDTAIANNDFENARRILDESMSVFPNDSDFLDRDASMSSNDSKLEIESIIALSNEKQAAEDYLGALNILSDALTQFGEVPELRSEYITCENRFVIQVQTKVNEKLSNDWEGAKTIAEDALNALPTNAALAALLQSVMLAKPNNSGNSGDAGNNGNTGNTGNTGNNTGAIVRNLCRGIDLGHEFIIGLRSNGTVVATGDNSQGQCNVGSWTDIVSVAAGYSFALGLRSNGTVVMTGKDQHNCVNRNAIESWRNIVQISAQDSTVVALDANGKVYVEGADVKNAQSNGIARYQIPSDVSNRNDAIEVSAGRTHIMVLFADGTVRAFGNNEYSICELNDWRNIVRISAGQSGSVGITNDGTVIYRGATGHAQLECNGLRGISQIETKGWHFAYITADGKVGACGYADENRCNVSSWNNLGKRPLAVTASLWNTAVLFADGTVRVTGNSAVASKLSNVASWTGIVNGR